jgi:hypothetical protein
MGCGWERGSDMRLVRAIEAVNGSAADTRWSGIPFWSSQLRRGLRITAIGGSDNHHADGADGPPGTPATVVYARELSQLALLEAIRAGHVFVDVAGSADRLLELHARAGDALAMMGDALAAPAGEPVRFDLHVAHAPGARIEVLFDGTPAALLAQTQVESDDSRRSFEWRSDGKAHWLRVDVRDGEGRLILLGNPVYLNAPSP